MGKKALPNTGFRLLGLVLQEIRDEEKAAKRKKEVPMCSGRKIAIKGFTVKDGKVKRGTKHLDVSTRLKQSNSKRVRVAKGRTTA